MCVCMCVCVGVVWHGTTHASLPDRSIDPHDDPSTTKPTPPPALQRTMVLSPSLTTAADMCTVAAGKTRSLSAPNTLAPFTVTCGFGWVVGVVGN